MAFAKQSTLLNDDFHMSDEEEAAPDQFTLEKEVQMDNFHFT